MDPGGTGGGAIVAGRYQIERLLGSGGMGNVYRAHDRVLDVPVALKILRPELVADLDALERFRREVRLARLVTDSHIARIFDIGESGSDRFLTMELIQGRTLRQLVSAGPLSVARAVAISIDVCAGLAAVHRAGIIHRDLKPDNVMIASDGRAVITDFGIARAIAAPSTTGVILGTPDYIAPEQVIGGATVDARADLYSFGVMLFEIVTGSTPFSGDGAMPLIMARLSGPPPDPRSRRPELPSSLAAAVQRCMAIDPEDRFADVAALRAALEAVRAGLDSSVAAAAEIARATTGQLATPSGRAVAPSSVRPQTRVAVLPFRNPGHGADDYLADALTEDLIDNLSMSAGLRVRPRGAVLHLRKEEGDPRQIGRGLEVDVVVEGSVRAVAGSLRITTRIIGVTDGYQIWAQRLERPPSEVLAVADETAAAIARVLTAELVAHKGLRPADPEALDLFLRARALYRHFDLESVNRAVELLERGLEISPDCPALLSSLAIACGRSWFIGGSGKSWEAQARDAASRALEVATDVGEPHAAMAAVEFQCGNFTEAIHHVRAALRFPLPPALAHEIYARISAEIGRLDEAERHHAMAIDQEPENNVALLDLARVCALRGDWDGCERLVRRSEEAMRSDFMHTGFRLRMAAWRGDREAVDRLRSSPKATATVQAALKDGNLAWFTESSANDSWRRTCFNHQLRAELRAYDRDIDGAIAEIAAAVEAGLIDVAWMARCPLFSAVRNDPRFGPLMDVVAGRAGAITAALG
jgi:serine/threonine-protein kinase